MKQVETSIIRMDNVERFKEICQQMSDTYAAKNHDYGNNNFEEKCKKRKYQNALSRMEEKLERFENLLDKDAKVNESAKDSLLDLACYAVMTYMAYEKLNCEQ